MTDVWVFGYGSLIWRPDFSFMDSRTAAISGWTRRFWQGSTDHRGSPGAPGRVVTLVRAQSEICRGRAYLIREEDRADVLSHLDYREKGGYSMHEVDMEFSAPDEGSARGLIYIAVPGNPNWLGEAPQEQLAEQVRQSSGPSGTNVEYVLELAKALRAIGAEDEHVFDLADKIAS
jgi:cation transport regulator ChaC